MEESREESMIFDVYSPATVHAANTARELIVSRDIKKYQQGLWVMLLSAGQSRVIYSGALARASVACEYIYIYIVGMYYCAFHKHANSQVQKPTDDCVFRCRQSS